MNQTIYETKIQQKYAGLTYEELIEIAQEEQMSDLIFIIAQPTLLEEFKEFLTDLGQEEYDEETATQFLREKDNRMMDAMDEGSRFLWEELL